MWRVLIADDEKLICKLVQVLVDWESLDMSVVAVAENGIDALEKIEEWNPDILITDIRMPGCNGLELIRQAKQIKPELEIIVISGYADFEYAQSAMSYGVSNYLLKPIKQDELTKSIQKIKARLGELQKLNTLCICDNVNSKVDLNRLRESLIKDILFENNSITVEKLIRVYYFMAKNGYYQSFILKIDYNHDNKMDERFFNAIQEKVKDLFYLNVSAVCEEGLIGFQNGIGYGILNYFPKNKEAVRCMMREFLNQLEANKNFWDVTGFSVGMGSVEELPNQLYKSMEHARSVIAEQLIEGYGKVLDIIPKSSGINIKLIIDRYAKVLEYIIEVADEKEADLALEELRKELMSVSGIRGREIFQVIWDVGQLFILRVGTEKTKQIQQDFEKQFMNCGNINGLFDILQKLQKQLLILLKQIKESEVSKPVRTAKHYIMQHFQQNITLEEVCFYVGFSPAYFSVMFKKETGEGFSKYITRIRMEEAKNLLRETRLSVSEICEKVGYNDRKHFTHTFNKFTGVNPAEYRKLYG